MRDLDTYIFADSQLHYWFDVRLPYSEPSGLFDGAAESVWDVRTKQASRHQAVANINQPLKVVWIFMQPISYRYFSIVFYYMKDIVVRWEP